MADRADATKPLNEDRNFPIGSAPDESFESAKLHDVKPSFIHSVVLIQQDRNLPVSLDARRRFDHNTFGS